MLSTILSLTNGGKGFRKSPKLPKNTPLGLGEVREVGEVFISRVVISEEVTDGPLETQIPAKSGLGTPGLGKPLSQLGPTEES